MMIPVLLVITLMVGAVWAQELTVREVAPGVVAVLQPAAGRFNDSNSVFLIGDDDVIVIDSQIVPSTTRRVIDLLKARTPLPVRYLINTHWHGDHIQGNSAWREAFPEIQFIAHRTLPEEAHGRGDPQRLEELEAWRSAIARAEAKLSSADASEQPAPGEREELQQKLPRWRQRLGELERLTIIDPDLLVETRLEIVRPEGPILIEHRPGHTQGDLAIFLPKQRVLITGDLVDDLPYGGHGSPRQWLESLEALQQLDFEWMIPGHGSIRRGKDHLDLIRRMVDSILRQTAALADAGLSLEEAQKRLDLEEFRAALAGEDEVAQRAFDHFIPAAVEQAWKEVKP